MPQLSQATMRKALLSRNKSFDGQFFYAVVTTGIFCLPSCSAKSAKPENIRFFADIEAAMAMGFRPCKRCQPMAINTCSEKLIAVVRHIEAHADQKITLATLGKIVGLSPSRLQKVFKQLFSISPKAYQDALRLQLFKSSLKQGESVTDAIYASGFGSTSRIYGEASRSIGMTPKTYRAGAMGESIHYACRNTTLGLMLMAATEKGICSVLFGDDQSPLIKQLQDEFPKATLSLSGAQDSVQLDLWMAELDRHINEQAPRPDLPLDIRGTAFQVQVWQFLLTIKEGEVRNYSEVAAQINHPKAVRAVGSACAKNRIALLIPCHRVLRSDGGLGGYRWGLERKQALLDKEL